MLYLLIQYLKMELFVKRINMGKYFGTDGFRGEVNKNLNATQAFKIGEFLAYYFIKNYNNKKFLIGRDTRLSGTMLEAAISAGITSMGGDVYSVGVIPTPAIAYLAKVYNASSAVVLTASHNPYYDNGIKLLTSNGEKMPEDVINLIEEYMDSNTIYEKPKRDLIGKIIDASNLKEDYINHLVNLAPNLKGFNIALDLANGAASSVAKAVFDKLGAKTQIINSNPDGININTNCGSTHIEGLAKLVKDGNFDIGFAYDGDADRCLLVDELGNILSGDHILYLYSKYLKDKNELKNNTVVTTVMSNFGLYKALDKLDIKYAKTKVGDKYVYEYMKENNCVIGGEQSGHIIFIKDASTGDGILTSLKVLEVLSNTNKKISLLVKDIDIYPQVLINIKVSDKEKVKNDLDVINSIKLIESKLDNTGRILVRESGTEPLIRVMVEAKDINKCNEYANIVINTIKNKGYEVK